MIAARQGRRRRRPKQALHSRAGPPSRHGAALALFALLLQALLIPLLHRPPPGSLPGAALAAAMAHCTAEGDRAPDSNPHPARHLPAGAKLPKCPVCLSLQWTGIYLPPSRIVVLFEPPAASALPLPVLTEPMPRRTVAGPQPRAPPLQA